MCEIFNLFNTLMKKTAFHKTFVCFSYCNKGSNVGRENYIMGVFCNIMPPWYFLKLENAKKTSSIFEIALKMKCKKLSFYNYIYLVNLH